MESFLIQNGVSLNNIGKRPTIRARQEDTLIETVIDVTMNKGLMNRIENWRVDGKYNGSDHNTIRCELRQVEIKSETRRPWDEVDWFRFKAELGKYNLYQPQMINEKKLDKMVECQYNKINKTFTKILNKKDTNNIF